MLKSITNIFDTHSIEVNERGETIPLHSNTSLDQGIFLQKIFDMVKPVKSLEIGFAYGISAMFILEKHRENQSSEQAHIVIEPDNSWGNAAIYNIEKEGLTRYLKIYRDFSDEILPQLFHEKYRIQYAYIDTSKKFDTVFHDFYYIDKILDIGGVIILDDCGGGWPGVQRVARFINTLPHYELTAKHNKLVYSKKKMIARKILSFLVKMLPFKQIFYPTLKLKNEKELGLDYNCLAFKKTAHDSRDWSWDRAF